MMLKAKFSNAVHKILEPNIDKKRNARWRYKKEYSDKQKLEMFDKIFALHNESSEEISKMLWEKRTKKRIQKEREAAGWVPKRKTTKAQYEMMLDGVKA